MHLYFVPVAYWRKCDVFYIVWYPMSNKLQFRHQTTGSKDKCIDRVHIKMIDRRIRDRMDKMTMNRPYSTLHDVEYIFVSNHPLQKQTNKTKTKTNSALIESISKWSTVELKIEFIEWLRTVPYRCQIFLLYVIRCFTQCIHLFLPFGQQNTSHQQQNLKYIKKDGKIVFGDGSNFNNFFRLSDPNHSCVTYMKYFIIYHSPSIELCVFTHI